MKQRQYSTRIRWQLTVLCLFALGFFGCESDLRIKPDGNNPPSFSLSGSGRLISFAVMEVTGEKNGGTRSDANTVLWEIEPTNADNKIWGLPSITYGKVPPGFTQKFPAAGAAPSPLVEGKTYEAGGPAYGANGGLARFKIQNNKSILIPAEGSK